MSNTFMVLAQLTARSLPIPEDPGSNTLTDNFLLNDFLLTGCRNGKKNKKEARKSPLKKTSGRFICAFYTLAWVRIPRTPKVR